MNDSDWLTRKEVAEIIKFSEKTLANWSYMVPPKGPRCVMVGNRARYRRGDVARWQDSQLASRAAA